MEPAPRRRVVCGDGEVREVDPRVFESVRGSPLWTALFDERFTGVGTTDCPSEIFDLIVSFLETGKFPDMSDSHVSLAWEDLMRVARYYMLTDLVQKLEAWISASLQAESSSAGLKALLKLQQAEWDAIDVVSYETQMVGRMFATFAEKWSQAGTARATEGDEAGGDAGSATGGGPVWRNTFWEELLGVPPGEAAAEPKAKAKAKGKAAAKSSAVKETSAQRLQREIRLKKAKEIREALQQKPPESCPRSGVADVEVWVLQVLAWAKSRCADLDTLVSLLQLRNFLRKVPTTDGEKCKALEPVQEMLDRGLRKRGRCLELLQEVAAKESVLEQCSLKGSTTLRPYADQEQVCRELLQSLRAGTPLLLGYRTPPSGGKTAAAALIGAVLQKERGRGNFPFLIYTCFSNAVRIDLSRTLLSASVPFAIVTDCVASPSWKTCSRTGKRFKRKVPPLDLEERVAYSIKHCLQCDEIPVVLVCDPRSAMAFCKHDPNYILVLDEVMAGTERSPALGSSCGQALVTNSRLLAAAPKRTLLLSATLPSAEDLDPLVQYLRERYEGLETRWVISERLPINFTARDPAGLLWAPHHSSAVVAKGGAGLVGLADALETPEHRHMLRFYSAAAVAELVPPDLPASEEALSHEGLRRLALRQLRALGEEGQPSRSAAVSAPWPEVGQACRQDAHKWQGVSLIVQDPEEYRTTEADPLVRDVDLGALVKDRQARITAGQKQKVVLSVDDDGRPLNKDQELASVEIDAALRWPRAAVINSREHFHLFAKGAAQPRNFRLAYQPGTDVLESSNEDLVKCLCAGAGVLGSPLGDDSFEAEALLAADGRHLAHVVADMSIIYGTNLPLDRVVFRAKFEEGVLDASAVMQLCGRVGRSGRSVSSEVVLPNELMDLAVSSAPGSREPAVFRLLSALEAAQAWYRLGSSR